MPGWVVSLIVGFAHGTIMALKMLILDGIHGGWQWNCDWWYSTSFLQGWDCNQSSTQWMQLKVVCLCFLSFACVILPILCSNKWRAHSKGSSCWKSSRQARGDWQIVLMTQELWVNVKRGIAWRNWRCNFCRATARMKPSVSWKNEPIQTSSQTHADVELERAGGKLEYVWGVVCNTEHIICWPGAWTLVC